MEEEKKYLSVYLQDHLAMAQAGVAFAHRIARENRGTPFGAELAVIAQEIEEEEQVVRVLLDRMRVDPSYLKNTGAWFAEKLGRLKLNGEFFEYSPLSRLHELEAMMAIVEVRLALWKTISEAQEHFPVLHGLNAETFAARAQAHLNRFEELHQRAAREMLFQSRSGP